MGNTESLVCSASTAGSAAPLSIGQMALIEAFPHLSIICVCTLRLWQQWEGTPPSPTGPLSAGPTGSAGLTIPMGQQGLQGCGGCGGCQLPGTGCPPPTVGL